jgi:LuxR family maltose regulon positive regulatory protein
MVQAERMFAEAVNAGHAAGNIYMLSAATDNLTQVIRAQGRWHEAITLCRETLEGMDKRGEQGMSMVYYSLADLLREMNELEAARHYADKSILLADRSLNPGHTIFSYFVLAHVKQAQQEWDGALEILAQVSSWMQKQLGMWNLDLMPAAEAQFRAMRGDLIPAFRWATANNWLEGPLAQVSTTWELIWQYEHLRVARAQIFIAQGRATGDRELLQDAAAYLNRQRAVAEASGLVWLQVKLFALQSLASNALGDHAQSASHLECALIMAQPEGCIRVFVDEGEPMRLLLLEHQSYIKKKLTDGVASESLRLLTYTDKLLAAFPQTTPIEKPKSKTIPEPLSERELDILRLIAMGRSNQEIAETLVIAISTVKSHINNLYSKLGTNRRTEAIAIARDMGLLSE